MTTLAVIAFGFWLPYSSAGVDGIASEVLADSVVDAVRVLERNPIDQDVAAAEEVDLVSRVIRG